MSAIDVLDIESKAIPVVGERRTVDHGPMTWVGRAGEVVSIGTAGDLVLRISDSEGTFHVRMPALATRREPPK